MLLSCMAFSAAHAISVGDHVYFGHYEQDNDRTNGPEKIEWIVLAKGDDRALLISKDALDHKPYNKEYMPMTWEKCNLRSWLNSYFYRAAFTEKERERILESAVPADKNPECNTDPGNDTFDKVFLLSITEAQKFFAIDAERKCTLTPFAREKASDYIKHIQLDEKTKKAILDQIQGGYWLWWLRSPGDDTGSAARVADDGSLFSSGDFVFFENAVRPALWIKL